MFKFIKIIMFSPLYLFWTSLFSQNYILYDFQANIQDTLNNRYSRWTEIYRKEGRVIDALCLTSETVKNKTIYRLFFVVSNRTTIDTNNLIKKEIIAKTNRVLKVNGIFIPLILDYDLNFGYFGNAPPRTKNGKPTKFVVFSIYTGKEEYPIIIFDARGKIYQNH